MDLAVLNSDQKVAVSDAIFDRAYNKSLVHQVVTSFMTTARQGTKAQKTRAEVRGGGVKPWKQKGTGRARAGTSRSPLWRKGGVIFAAKPRDFEQKVNRKMHRAAMAVVLSQLVREGRLLIVNQFDVATHKTKDLVNQLKSMDLTDVLIVVPEVNEKMYLAARNVYGLDVRDAYDIDVVSLVAYKKVLMTADVLKSLEEKLA
ncbi:MAG: 50S ribosomal protein L4 [Gammaproteobacteria bacterium]|nr:50S ribosomal protein L4 [Gammaproteobacteria bacterium]